MRPVRVVLFALHLFSLPLRSLISFLLTSSLFLFFWQPSQLVQNTALRAAVQLWLDEHPYGYRGNSEARFIAPFNLGPYPSSLLPVKNKTLLFPTAFPYSFPDVQRVEVEVVD